MKKQYFVWKDGKQNLDGKQEWVELTAKEFLEICNHNRKVEPSDRRYFARVPGVEEDDTYYLLECDYNSYLKSVAEAMELNDENAIGKPWGKERVRYILSNENISAIVFFRKHTRRGYSHSEIFVTTEKSINIMFQTHIRV